MKPFRFVLLVVICAGLSAPAGAAAKPGNGPGSSNLNATTTMFDADAFGASLYTRSDDYPLGASGQTSATYTTTGGANSIIAAGDGWQLLLANQTLRTVCLTLASQGVHDGTTVIPDGCYYQSMEVGSRCWNASGSIVAWVSIPAGTSQNTCSLIVDFTYGKTKYKLAMGPTFAGSGSASVACNSAGTNGCTSWTIAPNTAAANPTVANLYTYSRNGSLVLLGTYHNTYRVNVTVP
jgi:hypothetical protein